MHKQSLGAKSSYFRQFFLLLMTSVPGKSLYGLRSGRNNLTPDIQIFTRNSQSEESWIKSSEKEAKQLVSDSGRREASLVAVQT